MAYEYRFQGKTVRLEADPSVVAVRFNDPTTKSTRSMATESAGAGPFSTRLEVPGEKITIVPVGPGDRSETGHASALKRLNAEQAVASATPVFRVGNNSVVVSDRLLVGTKTAEKIEALAKKYNLVILRKDENEAKLQVTEPADVFELSQRIAKERGVVYAEPDFVTIGKHLPKKPSLSPTLLNAMTALPTQYAMRITHALEAHQIQMGVQQVAVAVLDEGVDTRHPDLQPAVAGTFDAVDNDTYQEPNTWDGHGTSCAGLVGGRPTAPNGPRGSGIGCSLFGVRIAYSSFKGGDWITTNDWIKQAIDWSWRNGASVLSNSWGGGAPSNAIASAFERARKQGRNGLGCVIVIAAGNSSGPVTFPGTLTNVITVSASNEFDEFKTTTTKDGESWWGSCYGKDISVAAPGVHNVTTDISGTAGYDAGNYTPTFNGTSSATPIVAGACALLLSANPSLTEADVRRTITETADKVGQYPYKKGRNEFFGHGRLNVLRALNAVRKALVA